MRFTITDEAITRLNISRSTAVDDTGAPREFKGFSTKEGLLGGVPRGVLKWVKRELKIDRIEQLDSADARLVYYLLALKNVDHTILPFARLDELALTDFELVKHEVTSLDQDGDCGECNQPLDAIVHVQSDGAPEPDPTKAPAQPGITATETPS